MSTRKATLAVRQRKGRGFDVSVCGRMISEDVKAKVEAATRRIGLAIMGAKLANTITIKVTLVRGLEGCNGDISTVNRTVSTTSMRAFPIRIQAGLPFEQMLKTLAHEIQHVEQIRRGRLQYRMWVSDRQLHVRWEGKEMGTFNSIPYYTRPWEVEARAAAEKFSKV